MKVLLIIPATKLMNECRSWRALASPIPSLGPAYIAAVLEKEGIEVKIIDQVAGKIDNRTLLKQIKEYSPRLIGFSCLTSVMNNVQELITSIRDFSDALIMLGNIHPTIFARELLEQRIADVVVRGEGEYAVLEVASAVEKGSGLHAIRGISYREGDKVFHNDDRPPIEDLDVLPYPAWHLFDLSLYKNAPMVIAQGERILPIAASRGCAFRCDFCTQNVIAPRLRCRKNEAVIKELEYMLGRFNVRNFGFMDANFPFSPQSGAAFCADLIRSGLHKKIRWGTETRVDLVNEDLLKIMKEAGVNLIMFGLETSNEGAMERVNKNISLVRTRRILRATKALKIYTMGLFILGLPGDTIETCRQTVAFARELDCDILKFNIAVPYPGTRLFEEMFGGKQGHSFDCEQFTPWCDWAGYNGNLIYVPDGMIAGELLQLQRRAMFGFYAQPRILFNLFKNRVIGFDKLINGAGILAGRFISNLMTGKGNRN